MDRPRRIWFAIGVQVLSTVAFAGCAIALALFGAAILPFPLLGLILGAMLLAVAAALLGFAVVAGVGAFATYHGRPLGFRVAIACHGALAIGLLMIVGSEVYPDLGPRRALVWATIAGVGTSAGLLLTEDARAWFHASR